MSCLFDAACKFIAYGGLNAASFFFQIPFKLTRTNFPSLCISVDLHGLQPQYYNTQGMDRGGGAKYS